jgi:hypothetical protein
MKFMNKKSQKEEQDVAQTPAARTADADLVSTQNVDPKQASQVQNIDQVNDPNNQNRTEVPKSTTAQELEGTITNPVSFSNPAYDASEDAAKVDLSQKDADKDQPHVFKNGHFYKKGDVVRYQGSFFEAIQDGYGDVPPNMWAPTSKES